MAESKWVVIRTFNRKQMNVSSFLTKNELHHFIPMTYTEKLKKDVHRYNRHLRVEKIATNYYGVKFRCLMAPMYLATYRFGKKTLQVAINGQTGETFCEAPTKIGRIILLGLLGLLLACALEVVILWLHI